MSALSTHDEQTETAAVCGRFRLSKPAVALFRKELLPAEFAAELLERCHFADAIRFVAHALTSRDGVWWACQCARQSMDADTAPEEEAAIVAAETWVTELSDETRRAAFTAANTAGIGTAAGSAALAVFYSGGSLTPPDQRRSLLPASARGESVISPRSMPAGEDGGTRKTTSRKVWSLQRRGGVAARNRTALAGEPYAARRSGRTNLRSANGEALGVFRRCRLPGGEIIEVAPVIGIPAEQWPHRRTHGARALHFQLGR